MDIKFYQIPKLFIDNSSFLGELIELNTLEVNVDLSNISRINLLLNNVCQEYNYIKVIESPEKSYYYYLESWKYYDGQRLIFYYNIDIIRTLYELDLLNHNVNISKYSNMLSMPLNQQAYFWNNQEIKLGSNLIEKYDQIHIPYSERKDKSQDVWKNMKWLYIWLQPRPVSSETVSGTSQIYQYSFTKRTTESIITVALETDLPIHEDLSPYDERYNNYPEGQVYFITQTSKYYRCIRRPMQFNYGFTGLGKSFAGLSGFNTTDTTYYLHTIPTVSIPQTPNSLYCLVLPLSPVKIIRNYIEDGVNKQKSLMWSADEVIPYLFDAGTGNIWNDFIVDFKISIVPPIERNDSVYPFVAAGSPGVAPFPAIWIENTAPGNDFTPINGLSQYTVKAVSGTAETNNLFLPFLKAKPVSIIPIKTNFVFPSINKENIIQKKFYLSIAEYRQELDIANLYANNATTLYYYEDVSPGRTNVIYGFAPPLNSIKELLYFLVHSSSTLFLDRDTSLPIFTSNYQSYLANNKNFVQQAQLQRSSELAQSLISSGSSMVGAGAVAKTLPGYNPYAATANAGAKTINALINYEVQTKQFHWAVDNMKSAPGNYKASTATLSLMLPFDIFSPWIETYKSNDFDINIYNKLINDVGFEYFNFSYNLKEVINNAFTGTSNKKYLQATLTGLTNNSIINMALINVLYQQLAGGINILINADINEEE